MPMDVVSVVMFYMANTPDATNAFLPGDSKDVITELKDSHLKIDGLLASYPTRPPPPPPPDSVGLVAGPA